jgi:glycogen(starch) synthase
VIASRIGGLPEIVRHRENGWLAENDPEPVAAAIRELFTDRELAQRLAARGRQTVAEKFSLDQMIDNTIRLYRQVLSC